MGPGSKLATQYDNEFNKIWCGAHYSLYLLI